MKCLLGAAPHHQERLLVVAPCQLQLTNITLTKKEIKKQGVFMISFSEKVKKKKNKER